MSLVQCPKCCVTYKQLENNFYRNRTRKTGYASQCKSCMDADHIKRAQNKQRLNGDPRRAWPTEKWSISRRLQSKSKLSKTTGCILWTGAKTSAGYGMLRFNKKAYRTHRLSYIEAFGEIKEGMHVLHRCDVPSCINPQHLFLGTHADNMRDMAAKGRHVGALGKRWNRK